MLPPFDDYGNLPPGIHPSTLDEIVQRFGSGSEERIVQIKELVQFIDWARNAGIRRIIINGSFVTGKLRPNDVDVIVLPGPDYPKEKPLGDSEVLWPFLQVIVAADDEDMSNWAVKDFGTDRQNRSKGVVELIYE
jgi:hypothetical protein